MAQRKHRAALEARRTIAEDPVESSSQFGNNAPDTFVRQGILVPGLGCGKQPQIFKALVADESLLEFCDALHNIDEVEHNPSFRSQHKIKVAQAYVKVDDDNFFAQLRERRTERSG